jgi:hypothetical protein
VELHLSKHQLAKNSRLWNTGEDETLTLGFLLQAIHQAASGVELLKQARR